MNITAKEVEVIELMVQGNTMAESARILQKSPRTIESLIVSLKNKTGSFKKAELLEYYAKNSDQFRLEKPQSGA